MFQIINQINMKYKCVLMIHNVSASQPQQINNELDVLFPVFVVLPPMFSLTLLSPPVYQKTTSAAGIWNT